MFSYPCLPAIVNRSVTYVYHAYLNHFNGKQSPYLVVVLLAAILLRSYVCCKVENLILYIL